MRPNVVDIPCNVGGRNLSGKEREEKEKEGGNSKHNLFLSNPNPISHSITIET